MQKQGVSRLACEKFLVMKKIIFFSILLTLSGLMASAQGGHWKIKLAGKQLLSTSRENEKQNVKKLNVADWNKKGYLEINFREDDAHTWYRSFLLVDADDNQLLSKDSVSTAKFNLATLRKLFKGKKELRIFTIVTPRDPNLAVRVRRVHLCTLRLP